MVPPLYGLVLAGGRSTRMQRDKATLSYQGRNQLDRAMELLGSCVAQVFVSVRADQRADPTRARYAQIVDNRDGLGPIAGIAAALAFKPEAAWLVLACDLPYLDARIVRFLIQSDALLLEQPDPRALDNINTPEEYSAARATLRAPQGSDSMQIKVQYYAILREQAGRSEETVATAARTPRDLYAELQRRHPFSLGADSLRVAINAEFSEWSQPLVEGDAVVFIPPVAGG